MIDHALDSIPWLAKLNANVRENIYQLAMFGMTQALGIEPVAEGVESAAQRDWLLSRGCLLQQGYLFGRPAPAELFEVWLAARPVVA